MTSGALPGSGILSLDTPLERRAFLRGLGRVGGALALGGLASACGSSAASTASTSAAPSAGAGAAGSDVGKGKTIAVVLNGNNAYTTYLAAGVLHTLEGTGYAFKGVQNNFDSSAELANVQSLLSQGVHGLVVLPVNAGTIAKAAQLAHAQGVPVGHALWPGESAADKYFAGVADLDSVQGGHLIGEYLKSKAKPGKVIVVQGVVGQKFSEYLDKGLDASLAGSGFTVAVRQEGLYDRTKAISIVESGLQAHPDTTAIVCYAASMSDGIASYLKSKNITGLTHVSSDADDELITWFGTPYLTADRYYSAAETGVIATKAVRAKLEGGSVPFRTSVRQAIVTADTVKAQLATDPFDYPQYKDRVATL